jgi:hypothetical protein
MEAIFLSTIVFIIGFFVLISVLLAMVFKSIMINNSELELLRNHFLKK